MRTGSQLLGFCYLNRSETLERPVHEENLHRDVGLYVGLTQERHNFASGELLNRLRVPFGHDALEVLAHSDDAARLTTIHDCLLERREATSAHDNDNDVVKHIRLSLHWTPPIMLAQGTDDARRDRRQELATTERPLNLLKLLVHSYRSALPCSWLDGHDLPEIDDFE